MVGVAEGRGIFHGELDVPSKFATLCTFCGRELLGLLVPDLDSLLQFAWLDAGNTEVGAESVACELSTEEFLKRG